MPAERVDLFIAGVQKAATTTLHAHLAVHPDVMTATAKEPHFFDNEALDWTVPDYAGLHDRFDGVQADRVALDATPIYTFWPPSLARLQAYNPDARLIVVFRDPIERAWSHWRMETSRNAETLGFSEAIRDGRARLDPANPLARIWRVASYVERSFYAGQVRRVLDFFPREQLLFLDSRSLTGDLESVLARVSDFAGIAPFEAVHPLEVHVGNRAFGTIPPEDAAYLRELFRDDLLEFATLTEIDVSSWPTLNPDEPIR